jgi:hypothetical protein
MFCVGLLHSLALALPKNGFNLVNFINKTFFFEQKYFLEKNEKSILQFLDKN